MKKILSLIIAGVIMCSNVFASDINVKLDGEPVVFNGQGPVISEGRTLIPLRGVFEQLGYEISWDNSSKSAEFVKDDVNIKITAGMDEFTVNGESISLDVPAQIINGSMMLPLRAVGEASGLKVDWNNDTKSVNISSKEGTAQTTAEEVTETTTEESVDKVYRMTDEEAEKYADEYIDYAAASSLAVGFLYNEDAITELLYEAETGEDIFALIYVALEEENMFLEKAEGIKTNIYTQEMISELKNTINTAIELRTEMMDVLTGEADLSDLDKTREHAQGTLDKYNDEIYDFKITLEKCGERYAEAKAEYDWDYDKLTDEQTEEIRGYQKQVGDMLEKALDVQLVDNEDEKSIAKKMRTTAENIRKGMKELTPPDFAAADDDILIKGCDFIDQAADIYEKGNDSIEYMYVNVLLTAFDACAKTCAGDYYVSAYVY